MECEDFDLEVNDDKDNDDEVVVRVVDVVDDV